MKIAKLNAESKPKIQPFKGILDKSASITPAAKIVPKNKMTKEIDSIREGSLRFSAQSINVPIHVNWNNMTTASDAGK